MASLSSLLVYSYNPVEICMKAIQMVRWMGFRPSGAFACLKASEYSSRKMPGLARMHYPRLGPYRYRLTRVGYLAWWCNSGMWGLERKAATPRPCRTTSKSNRKKMGGRHVTLFIFTAVRPSTPMSPINSLPPASRGHFPPD